MRLPLETTRVLEDNTTKHRNISSWKFPTNSSVLSRSFDPWPVDHPLPCFPPGNVTDKQGNLKTPARRGLFFLKLLKSASSTAASVHLRIARNLAEQKGTTYEICKTRHLHGWAGPRMYHFGRRDTQQSFLWTMIREPHARYISEFFHFQTSREGVEPTNANLVHFLQYGRHADQHSISWLSTKKYEYRNRRHRALAYRRAGDILDEYDFIGIAERFDESMVLLSMLLRLPLSHVLYVSSKQAGGYDDGEYKNRCVKIQHSSVSTELQDFFDTDVAWNKYIGPEQTLYLAANQSIDKTILSVGQDTFQQNLALFRSVQAVVEQRCKPKISML